MKPLVPNTLLQNRYLIIQLIGKGGMGEVYLAVDQRLGSGVALKRTFFSDDEMLGNAFEREAKTLARLRHPVLPKVSDHFTEDDTQYLVMEHISGDDLSKRLEQNNKPFPLSWVLFWADQLLDALVYLHSHEPQIIHRDIKPQNLKLTDENHIILLDFGLAKNSKGQTRVTTAGSIVGYTPHYASMEQIRGTGTSPKSDIYSLCATLYQLLTNSVPADALTRADSLLNNLPDPLRPVSEINAEVPQAISAVLLKGMSLSADQRYETAREMQKALREAYAEMQHAMSAQTVAFAAAPAVIEEPAEIVAAPMPEVVNEPEPTVVSNIEPVIPPTPLTVEAVEEPVVPEMISAAPVIEQTVAFTAEPQGEKTELFTGDQAASIAEQVPAEEPVQESFSPEATVPLVRFDEGADRFDSVTPQAEESSHSAYIEHPVEESVREDGATFTPPPPPPPVQQSQGKKGGGMGKVVGILAGFAIVGLIGIGAAVAGWYAFGGGSAGTASPTPTPDISNISVPTPLPTVEPTLTPAVDVNSNSSQNANSNIDMPANTDSTPTSDKTPRPGIEDVKVAPTPVRSATPRPTVAGTPLRTPPPAKTPTPAKTPPKGRTEILQ